MNIPQGAKLWLAKTRLLTHWGRVTHICVSNLTIIVSDNGLSPGRRQAIIWNNVGLLLIEPLGINFSEILIEIHTFSFKKMHLKLSSAKWRLCCLRPNAFLTQTDANTFWLSWHVYKVHAPNKYSCKLICGKYAFPYKILFYYFYSSWNRPKILNL